MELEEALARAGLLGLEPLPKITHVVGDDFQALVMRRLQEVV